MKCISGFNHHRRRGNAINKKLCSSECPCHKEEEDWGHVSKHEGIQQIKVSHAAELVKALRKETRTEDEKKHHRHGGSRH